ncbi:MAG TPA: polyprenyl synthetase family protein, partial [Roseiflexaceae bacterium]|nr:polyprenyl synthetase family protein [Roseiflexaceae bacterium]
MSQLPVPAELAPDLKRVDQIIAERTTARPVVAGIAGPHLGAGAGRWRAVVALLAARLGAYAPERAAHAAAAVELIYAAARVHDSLVDEAARRRGQMAAQAHWGSSAALMVGDYLFALAAAEMALAPDPRVIAAYSRSVMAICEGQLAPVTSVVPLDVARNQYLYRAGRIDAALFEAAARAGAACSELAPEQADALGRFGYDLGLALRIAADARDYEGPG